MKKTTAILTIAMTAAAAAMPHARPAHAFRAPPPRHHCYIQRHRAPMPPAWHYYNGSFWTGLGTGIILSSFAKPMPAVVSPAVPVIQTTVVQQNQVWVPPVYEIRPVYDAFGNIIRHEQVLVRAGYWR